MNFEVETKYTYEEFKRYNEVVLEKIYKSKRKKFFAIVLYIVIIFGFVILKEYLLVVLPKIE